MAMRVLLAVASLAMAVTGTAAGAPAHPAPVEVEHAHTRGELPTSWGTALGDLDAIRERGVLRALVVPGHIAYFVQDGRQHGMVYEWLVELERELNRDRKKGALPLRVAVVPSSPDAVLDDLRTGRGDIAAYALTVTPSRATQVDFVAHIVGGRHKVVVTRTDVPELSGLDALGDREVWVRARSSALEELDAYNARARATGTPRIRVKVAPPHLIDEDLLQMVDAGLIDATITHAYKVELFGRVFKRIKAHPAAELAHDEELAWAVRKGSPLLKGELDRFWKRNAAGTTLGNVLIDRYLKRGRGLQDSRGAAERRKYEELVGLFRKHAARYDMDHLLMLAQGYQESQLEQQRRSQVGAIGVMQLLPATGAEMKVGDITQLEPNIHAGVKYMRWIIDHHFADPRIPKTDRVLLGFAAYNAGPTRIQQMRREAARRGLDPDRWFGNVEVVTAHRVGREPVDYVSNIYKYYVAYTILEREQAQRAAAKGQRR